jgi:hypothetical protein
MKVKMIKTKKGSPDGFTVCEYLIGESYDIPDDLAKVFIEMEVAEEFEEAVISDESIKEYIEEVFETPEKPKQTRKYKRRKR